MLFKKIISLCICLTLIHSYLFLPYGHSYCITSPGVSEMGSHFIAIVHDRQRVPDLLAELRSIGTGDQQRSSAIVAKIVQIGDVAIEPVLQELHNQSNTFVCRQLVSVLDQLHWNFGAASLEDRIFYYIAADVRYEIRKVGTDALPCLEKGLQIKDSVAREKIINFISEIGGINYLRIYVKYLKDESQFVREAAGNAIRQIGLEKLQTLKLLAELSNNKETLKTVNTALRFLIHPFWDNKYVIYAMAGLTYILSYFTFGFLSIRNIGNYLINSNNTTIIIYCAFSNLLTKLFYRDRVGVNKHGFEPYPGSPRPFDSITKPYSGIPQSQ
jgi:hypothetical protein